MSFRSEEWTPLWKATSPTGVECRVCGAERGADILETPARQIAKYVHLTLCEEERRHLAFATVNGRVYIRVENAGA